MSKSTIPFSLHFLAVLILFVSCSKEEVIKQHKPNTLELQFDDQKYTLTGESAFGNSSCGMLSVTASPVKETADPSYRVIIRLTNTGRIEEVFFFDYADNNRHYKTADYNAAKDFFIRNFRYSPEDKNLSFEFEGTLHEKDHAPNTRQISGKVSFNEYGDYPCTYAPWKVAASLGQAQYESVYSFARINEEQAQWRFFSDDGFNIDFITAEALENMAPGTYTFTQDQLLNRISMAKYIGISKATSFKMLLDEEWENYSCEGVLIIDEQLQTPFPHTKGRFSFAAFKDGVEVYQVANGTFEI